MRRILGFALILPGLLGTTRPARGYRPDAVGAGLGAMLGGGAGFLMGGLLAGALTGGEGLEAAIAGATVGIGLGVLANEQVGLGEGTTVARGRAGR
jgi:hypothetical protein